jgi:isoquinoline 1-oxidoreductase beta subunit
MSAILKGTSAKPSRRAFIKGGIAGGFLLAFHVPVFAGVNEPNQPPDDTNGKFAPNAFIRIDKAGKTTLVMPQVEMGQGVYTSVAMILAEELDADYSQVTLEHAPPDDKAYGNPVFGIQVTGNSNSIRAFWKPLRTAGASARAMMIQAAAKQWKVDPSGCTASDGKVTHGASNRTLSYGALADTAAKETPPKDPPLKDPKNFKLIGKPQKRFDTPSKVDGSAVYGIDAMLPGMKFATIAASPVFGGKVSKVDDSAAKQVPGVQQVIALDDMVAVVGDHFWAAKSGLDALKITWDHGPNAAVSNDAIWKHLRDESAKDGVVAKAAGDVNKALESGDKFHAVYELPFLAHATMEPMNCTVQIKPDGGCEIWQGTQVISRVQQTVAKLLGVADDKVVVHNHLIGGGFGRRLEPDMALKAVRVAQHMNGEPVKVVWSREEDMQQDVYRPVYRDEISATVSDGKIAAWKYKISGSSVIARWLPPAFQKGIDIDAIDCAVDQPYDFPNFEVRYVRVEPPAVPTGFWRGVGPNNNVFALECFIDEVAKKLNKDPIAFRKSMLDKGPRFKAVLDLVAQKSGWGQPLGTRVGRGVCLQPAFGSFIATVIEAEVDEHGEVLLRKITTAVDTGIIVNPDTVVAQLQGGIIFGLTAALYGEVTIDGGRVQQSNFHNYRMLRIDQIPAIEVHLVQSGEAPGGIGETGATAGPPALRNAIYAATGIPLRRLPIDREVLAGRKQPWA